MPVLHSGIGYFKRRRGRIFSYRFGVALFACFRDLARKLAPMGAAIQKISAVTFRVRNMKASVRFYRDVVGMHILYGAEVAAFSSLYMEDTDSAILNLEQGETMARWGRLIFHVSDVDEFSKHLTDLGFEVERLRNAAWGERYFHMHDPDGHELSFARPLQSDSSKE